MNGFRKLSLDRRRELLLAAILASPKDAPKRALLPPSAEDDSSRHRVFAPPLGMDTLREKDNRRSWSSPARVIVHHGKTLSCFLPRLNTLGRSAGLGWVVTPDVQGNGDAISQGSKSLGGKQVAFDVEVAAIKEAIKWFREQSNLPSVIVHSDSTSAIARRTHGSRNGAMSCPRHTSSAGGLYTTKEIPRPRQCACAQDSGYEPKKEEKEKEQF